MNDDPFRGLGVEVDLAEPDDFLKVRETLTRLGVVVGPKTLEQTTHILHKRGRYALMHYKEMYEIDGDGQSATDEDLDRRDLIARRLQEWGLLTIVDEDDMEDEPTPPPTLKVIAFRDKDRWSLVSNYTIGGKQWD